jgi:hypothetical protein
MVDSDYLEKLLDEGPMGEFIQREFVEKPRQRKEFFESPEFNCLYGIISSENEIDEEGLAYETQIVDGLTRESLSRFCSSVLEVRGDDPRKMSHYVYELDYKEITIRLVVGQGSWYSTRKNA